jgi:hypothetical protein
MPVATLRFKLPEEQGEFDTAQKAGSIAAALFDVGQNVFRPARKHGYPEADIQNLITKLDDLARQAHGPIPPNTYPGIEDATHLVSLLEKKFYEILNKWGVAEHV